MFKKIVLGFLISVITSVLFACAPKPSTSPVAMNQIQTVLANSIRADQRFSATRRAYRGPSKTNDILLPPLAVKIPDQPAATSANTKNNHFDVTVKDMPAREFFMGLVEGTKYNMIIDPAANDKITLKLKNVTIDETLDAVRELYGYEYRQTDYGYEILSPKMTTQIFSINYLNINRQGQSRTQLTSTEITNNPNVGSNATGTTTPGGYGQYNQYATNNLPSSGSSVVTKSENDFWGGLKTTLTTLVSAKEGQWVVVNPQASVVMVHAYPKALHEVSEYLDTIQGHLNRQVTIEAKILEVQLSDAYQAGIDWRVLSTGQFGATKQTDLDQNFNGGIFSLAVNGPGRGDFASLIDLLEQQGNLQVLSSPRISTINNQEAVIKVGDDEFFVTGYSSNLVPSGNSTATTQSVALNPFFSGITLDVTPQISSNGNITLYIHPSVSLVTDQQKTIELANANGTSGQSALTLPLAHSTIRESDDVVHAKNGQVVVIGGLMQTLTREQIAATPWLSKLPFAGAVGRNTHQLSNKVELVILLKPVISTNRGWTKQLQDQQRAFGQVNRGFHFGSRPSVFGTMAEKHP